MPIEEIALRISELGVVGIAAMALFVQQWARIKTSGTELLEAKAKVADAETTSKLVDQQGEALKEIVAQLEVLAGQMKQTTRVQELLVQALNQQKQERTETEQKIKEGFTEIIDTIRALRLEIQTSDDDTRQAVDDLRTTMDQLKAELDARLESIKETVTKLAAQFSEHNQGYESRIEILEGVQSTLKRVEGILDQMECDDETKGTDKNGTQSRPSRSVDHSGSDPGERSGGDDGTIRQTPPTPGEDSLAD